MGAIVPTCDRGGEGQSLIGGDRGLRERGSKLLLGDCEREGRVTWLDHKLFRYLGVRREKGG